MKDDLQKALEEVQAIMEKYKIIDLTCAVFKDDNVMTMINGDSRNLCYLEKQISLRITDLMKGLV